MTPVEIDPICTSDDKPMDSLDHSEAIPQSPKIAVKIQFSTNSPLTIHPLDEMLSSPESNGSSSTSPSFSPRGVTPKAGIQQGSDAESTSPAKSPFSHQEEARDNTNNALDRTSPTTPRVTGPSRTLADLFRLMKQHSTVDVKEGDVRYLVSSRWWNKLIGVKESLRESQSTSTPPSPSIATTYDRCTDSTGFNSSSLFPGPIDNSALATARNGCNGRIGDQKSEESKRGQEEDIEWEIQAGLELERDYMALPDDAWRALVSIYGLGQGPSLRREFIKVSGSAGDTLVLRVYHDTSEGVAIPADHIISSIARSPVYADAVKENESQTIPKEKAINRIGKYYEFDCGVVSPTDILVPFRAVCFCCATYKKGINKCSSCKSIYYCSVACQKAHWQFHKSWCKQAKAHSTLPPTDFRNRVPIGNRGKCGLWNIGNSCYLASAIQCLSHITPLTRLLLGEGFKAILNVENRDGSGGRLTVEYSSLLRELWLGSKSSLRPTSVKRILGSINEDFATMEQLDAYEAVRLILDKLHEDLNSIIRKPYIENPEGDGTNDEEVSEDAWKKSSLRDDSPVRSLIAGQLRSQLDCGRCGRRSVNFEAFSSLELAIPTTEQGNGAAANASRSRNVQLLFVPSVHKMMVPGWKSSSGGLSKAEEEGAAKDTSTPLFFSIKAEGSSTGLMLREYAFKRLLAEERISDKSKLGLFILSKDYSNVVAIFHDSQTASSVSSDEVIAIYEIPQGTVPTLFILQKGIQKQSDVTATSDTESYGYVGKKGKSRVVDFTGYPVLISLHSLDLKCTFVRMKIWLQLRRIVLSRLRGWMSLSDEGLIELQKFLASKLPLHLIYRDGRERVVRQQTGGPTREMPIPALSREEGALFRRQEGQEDYLDSLTAQLSKLSMSAQQREPREDASRVDAAASSTDHSCEKESEVSREEKGGEAFTLGLPSFTEASALPGGMESDLRDAIGGVGSSEREIFFLCVDWSSSSWVELFDEEESIKCVNRSDQVAGIKATESSSVAALMQLLGIGRKGTNNRGGSEGEGELQLEDCFRHFIKEEHLQGDNAWYCGTCKSHQPARKSVKLWRPPKVLILGLKRYEQVTFDSPFMHQRSVFSQRKKISTFVGFPVSGFDLSPYLDRSSPFAGSDSDLDRGEEVKSVDLEPKEEDGGCLYDLFAVCNHYGRLGFGHYTSIARELWEVERSNNANTGEWHQFDDEYISTCRDKDVVSNAAYVLFYKQRSSA